MRAYIELKSHSAGFTAEPAIFLTGRHSLRYGEKLVQLDWDYSSTDAELDADGRITITTELRGLSDVYAEDWEAQGLDRQAVEELLSSNQLTEVDEIFYQCYEDPAETKPILLEVTKFMIEIDSAQATIPAELLEHYNTNQINQWTK